MPYSNPLRPSGVPGGSDVGEMRSLTILYAEDEVLVAMCVIEALEDRGHSVHHLPTGDAAAAEIGHLSYDVLLTDLRMPGNINGLDLIALSREASPSVPVILISGTPPQNMRRDEVTAVLEKPCTLQDVIGTIERVASAASVAA